MVNGQACVPLCICVCGQVLKEKPTLTADGEEIKVTHASTAWQSEIIVLLLKVTQWTMIHTVRCSQCWTAVRE